MTEERRDNRRMSMRKWKWTGRVGLSDGVEALGIDRNVLWRLVKEAIKDRKDDGVGNFCYQPMIIVTSTQRVDVIVCLYYNGNDKILPGDASVHLRSEWDELNNPLP
jgi:hypothetical protein